MKNIIYVSEFAAVGGSGYGVIASQVCPRLLEHDIQLLVLSPNYKGEEHPHLFAVVPARPRAVPSMIKSLTMAKDVEFHAIISAMDIPQQRKLRGNFGPEGVPLPHIGIFPVESGPLCDSWAVALAGLDAALVISEFGTVETIKAGVNAKHIPIGVDTDFWRAPEDEERVLIRKGLGITPETKFILTIADNQERKNLVASIEMVAALHRKAPDMPLLYGIVTRPRSPIGYELMDYAMEMGIIHCFQIWQRGMSAENLWGLCAAADVFLLASKAEGLGMPIMEVMGTKTPVVGTDCAAIHDHLSDGRGYLIPPAYKYRDSWGNEWRCLADIEQGAELLVQAMNGNNTKMLEKARSYVEERTWEKTTEVLVEAINNVT